ncbi:MULTISPECIES: acyl-CoA carboxylase subunit epsilon [unclassified Streptomyces]|uniref:acyl-CoA carboxylase subunit epsilon n=1 Tax=unclassified Streptomyces TaxID=2593676 RepID=UPI0036A1D949
MGDFDTGKLAFRVERGRASDEELAAVTVVLCSVLAGRDAEGDDVESPDVPLWQPERSSAVYRSPYSWR